jgi:YD repeat-containing protein
MRAAMNLLESARAGRARCLERVAAGEQHRVPALGVPLVVAPRVSRRRLPLELVVLAALLSALALPPAALASPRLPSWDARRPDALRGARVVARDSGSHWVTYALPDGRMLTQVTAAGSSGAQGGTPPMATQASKRSTRAETAVAMANASFSGNSELACTIRQASPTLSECNAASLQAGEEKPAHGTAYATHALLQFSIPGLDHNATVLKATMELYETSSSTTTAVSMAAYEVGSEWGKGVTWETTNGTTPWKTAGGEIYESSAFVISSIGTASGWRTWYPTREVQRWINGAISPKEGATNLGLLLRDEKEVNNVVTFEGPGQTHAPVLSFEWTPRGAGEQSTYTMLSTPGSTPGVKVNAASGNLFVHDTDLKIISKALPFEVSRTFNSLAPEILGDGHGWVEENAPSLELGPQGGKGAEGSFIYTDPTGNTFVFLNRGAGPIGIEATICEKGESACRTMPESTTYRLEYTTPARKLFFDANAKNYPVETEKGTEAEHAKYTSGLELPTSWLDSYEKTIGYTETKTEGYTKADYEINKEIATYTEKPDTAGAAKLVEYLSHKGEKTTYEYGTGASEGLLTKITEPSGAVLKISYDSEGQVAHTEQIEQGQTSGPAATYTYYEVGKAPAPCTSSQKATVVAEANGAEEPPITYCANVLDEIEAEAGAATTGQPAFYATSEKLAGEAETLSVVLDTGNLLLKAEDVKPEEGNDETTLNRFYNSQAPATGGPLSSKWRWNTGPQVYLAFHGENVVVHGPSGYVILLKRTSATTFAAAQEEYEGTLTENSNGTYTLANAGNPTENFSASGVLESETTEAGQPFTVTDTTDSGESVLSSLTPSSGSALQLKYNGTPAVTEVTDPAGHVGKYEYNTSGELSSYTSATGEKVEYEYENGYLSKVTTPTGITTITTTDGKVSDIRTDELPSGTVSTETFTYEAPAAPTCTAEADVEETLVKDAPSNVEEAYCFNALGENITPRPESVEEELTGEEEPEELLVGACEKEHPGAYCGQEEPPPEEEGDVPATAHRAAATSATTKEAEEVPFVPPRSAPLRSEDFGIADGNRLQAIGENEHFDMFTNPYFEKLGVRIVRRSIPWNLVYEAERGPFVSTNKNKEVAEVEEKEAAEQHVYAENLLIDVELWLEETMRLDKGTGIPVISFDHCLEPGDWVDPQNTHQLVSCATVAKLPEYTTAIEAFLKRKVFEPKEKMERPYIEAHVAGDPEFHQLIHRYTAWNEPDNPGFVVGSTTEHVEPTVEDPTLAGEYWNKLSYLCRHPEGYDCNVAAGDFLDAGLPDVWYKKVRKGKKKGKPNPYYKWFGEYLKGMGEPHKASFWAWHPYEDGRDTWKEFDNERQHQWWSRFKYFAKRVEDLNPNADIWITEAGAVLKEPGTRYSEAIEKKKALERNAKGEADAVEIANAYVGDGRYQLTNIYAKTTMFLYYQMRAHGKTRELKPGESEDFEEWDSGLLEDEPAKGEETYFRKPVSAPRPVYGVYYKKTSHAGVASR